MERPTPHLASLSSPPLLERDGELTRISTLLDRAAAGAGGVLLVEGPAGAGKSALLRAAREQAAAAGFAVSVAVGRELQQGSAFAAATELLAGALAATDPAAREAAFDGAAALARPLFEPTPEQPGVTEPFAGLHGLHWLAANLATRRPLLLVLDDAHWCDRLSLDFAAHLAERVAELPLCLAVAVRRGETEAGTRLCAELTRARAQTLSPAPLTEAAVARLLAARAAAGEHPGLAAAVAQATGGNPLFLRELLRGLEGTAAPGDVLEQVPRSVAWMVQARLERLEPDDALVARAAAVLGDASQPELLRALCDLPDDQLAAAIDRLIGAGLFAEQAPVGFEHPIVRRAVYDAVAPAARATDHLTAARALAVTPSRAEQAADHVLSATVEVGELGAGLVAALRLAARRTAARDRSAGLLERVLREPLPAEQRRAVELELGTVELALGRPGAVDRLGDARAHSPPGPPRAEAALVLASAQMQAGELGAAAVTCQQALREVAEHRELRMALEASRAHALWVAGALTEADRDHLAALEREVAAGATPAERSVLTVLAAVAGSAGSLDADHVGRLAERALSQGRHLADLGAEHPTYATAVAATTMAGRLGDAVAHWTAGVEDAQHRGSLAGYANALSCRAYSRSMRGDLDAAEEDALEGLAIAPERASYLSGMALAAAASVAAERGTPAEATEDALETLCADDGIAAPSTVTYALMASGALALSRSHTARALARFEAAGRRARRDGWACPSCLPWRSAAALVLPAERRDEAQELIADELELARAFGAPGPVGIALRAQADLAGDSDGVELARQAVDTLAGSEAALEHAKALVTLGTRLRRSGAPRDARAPLREGLHRAHGCGADVVVGRALDELRAAGARPRRPELRGVAALSPQERQTCRHAVAGLGNREIAQAMFLTRRTVEMHLTSAYRKLGVSSREELPSELEAARREERSGGRAA